MRRKKSRYPRTSYRGGGYLRSTGGPRRGLTRRSLLGVVALVTGGTLADVLRGNGHHAAALASRSTTVPSSPPTRPANEAAVTTRPSGASLRPADGHHSSRPGAGAGQHHGPSPSPGHGHGHGRGDPPPSHHHTGPHSQRSGHHAGDGHAGQHRAQERVTLPAAKVRVRSRPIYSVADIDPHPPKRAIALTVDDGPDPDWTPKVLRLLDKHRMQASFCVVGIHADSYPRLIRDIHRAGHVIVNHSYTHVQPFAKQSEKRIVAEITRAQRAIERAAKVTPELFRSPGGDWSPFIFRAAASYGLTPLDWDLDPMDWARPGTRKIERAMLRGRPGDIVLCHDGGGNRSETVRALRKVLPAWKHRGYTTIPLVVAEAAKRPPSSQSPGPSSSPSASPSGSGSGTPSP